MAGRVSYDFTSRVALVTGATGGLGPAVVAAFATSGAMVCAVVHREQPDILARLRAGLDAAAAARVALIGADVMDEASVVGAVGQVESRFGHLDIAINAVGGYDAGQPVHETDIATWQHMMDLNVRSAFLVAKHVVPPMVRQGFGRLIHISSRAAFGAARNAAAYGAAKRAVLALTEAQAAEVRETGVTVNAIVPSIIDTAANRRDMPNARHDRWPKPAEVASVISFLASDDAALISGAAIPVYGLA